MRCDHCGYEIGPLDTHKVPRPHGEPGQVMCTVFPKPLTLQPTAPKP
jgi:hypothetical protein